MYAIRSYYAILDDRSGNRQSGDFLVQDAVAGGLLDQRLIDADRIVAAVVSYNFV